MTELQLFQNEAFKVRAMNKESEAWFIAKDIADILEYSDSQAMTRRLEQDECSTYSDNSSGQVRTLVIINESGLFNAILGSKKPEAKAFKKWVTSEVLPTIRKSGGYLNPTVDWTDLDNIQKVIDVAKKERAKRIRLEELRKEDQPKLEFYHAVRDTENTITFEDFGRITGYGKNKLFRKARELKLVDHQNKAYQRYIDEGFFELKKKMTKIADHDVIYFQTRITGKGQA